jgi:hypothetical protein
MVSFGEGALDIEVLIGTATIESIDGRTLELGEGEIIDLSVEIGIAEFEDVDAGPPEALDSGPVDLGEGQEIVIRVQGAVQMKGSDGQWSRVPTETESVPAGSELRVSRRGSVRVSRGPEVITIGGGSEAVVGAEDSLVRMASGRATIESTERNVVLGVPGGLITGRASAGGGRSEVQLRRQNAHVNSRAGAVELRSPIDNYTARQGQSGILNADGSIEVEDRAPTRVHLAVAAGASAIIHDVNLPVAVRVRFDGVCSGEGVVEVARGASFTRPRARSFGNGGANVALPQGANRYRVRCSVGGTPKDEVAAEGLLTIRRDSGRAPLPPGATHNFVDTDGRPYTIYYQNHLPKVTVRWRDAPSAPQYTLHVRPQRGAEDTHTLGRASHTFQSGQIRDGVYRVWFDAPFAAPPESRKSMITVRYDSAASVASIREPGTSPIGGQTVRVSGTAVQGCTVSVGGAQLPLDRALRFSGTATVPTEVDAVAIRINHPRTGVHYYLRRVAR